jgi:hypothetical protein
MRRAAVSELKNKESSCYNELMNEKEAASELKN